MAQSRTLDEDDEKVRVEEDEVEAVLAVEDDEVVVEDEVEVEDGEEVHQEAEIVIEEDPANDLDDEEIRDRDLDIAMMIDGVEKTTISQW